jgi:hypothetical protein
VKPELNNESLKLLDVPPSWSMTEIGCAQRHQIEGHMMHRCKMEQGNVYRASAADQFQQ